MNVVRLSNHHDAALEELLLEDPVVNLFLLGVMSQTAIEAVPWYAVVEEERLRAVLFLTPDRLAVPWAPDRRLAEALAMHVRWRHAPCPMVGPREACDAIWGLWAVSTKPDRYYDQRLYIAEQPCEGPPVEGFRQARVEELGVIAANSAKMEREDVGRDPERDDPAGHRRTVESRIRRGAVYVIERRGQIVFQINLGMATPWGAQVGGTYVPDAWRGQGLAKDGMRALLRTLLPRYGRVTLHVNEANLPAVRVYEASGFVPSAAYRLIMLARSP